MSPENLPFNHYNDDSDFFNAVLDVIPLSIDYNRLMNLVFNPFTFDNKCVLLNDQFIDPDTNFFNDGKILIYVKVNFFQIL